MLSSLYLILRYYIIWWIIWAPHRRLFLVSAETWHLIHPHYFITLLFTRLVSLPLWPGVNTRPSRRRNATHCRIQRGSNNSPSSGYVGRTFLRRCSVHCHALHRDTLVRPNHGGTHTIHHIGSIVLAPHIHRNASSTQVLLQAVGLRHPNMPYSS